jgi:hypothetical protein
MNTPFTRLINRMAVEGLCTSFISRALSVELVAYAHCISLGPKDGSVDFWCGELKTVVDL